MRSEVTMSRADSEKEGRKEAMKALRRERKRQIASASAAVKAQRKAIKAIKEILGQGAKTVPELVEGTGMPPLEVFWYIASLKKYGEIIEGEKDGAYYRYALASGAQTRDEE